MNFAIVDMEANFVPGSGNQMGVRSDEWLKSDPLTRLSEVLDIIAESDFEYLELGTPWICGDRYDEVRNLVESKKLETIAGCSLVPSNIKTVGPEFNEKNIGNYLDIVFERFGELCCKFIVFGSGGSRNVPAGYPKKDAFGDVVKFLKIADGIIRKNNYPFKIAIEPLCKAECNFINSLKEAYDVACAADSSNVGVLMDLYHACLQENPFWGELDLIKDKLFHIHLAQPSSRLWPGCTDDFDFGRLALELGRINYVGHLSVECNFNNLPVEISKCHDFLKRTFDAPKSH